MELKSIFTDDDAVSPVIGVILMVAITVILAAVIGAFVLGIGSNQESAPQATIAFNYETSGTSYSVVHDGGASVDGTKLTLKKGGTEPSDCNIKESQFSAGDTMTDGGACDYTSGDEFSIVWTSSSGDSTQIIKESTAP